MRTTLRRVAASSAGVALALTGLAGLTSSPASADPSPSSASATSWLAGELTNGLFHFVLPDPPNPDIEYDEYGLSLDRGFAALSAGNTAVGGAGPRRGGRPHQRLHHRRGLRRPRQHLRGSDREALVYAQVSGVRRPRSGPSTWSPGSSRWSNRVAGWPTSPLRRQRQHHRPVVRRARARHRGQPKAADVTAFLLKQQCPAGFFRLHFAGRRRPLCGQTRHPDTDVTAFVMLNLQNQSQKPEVGRPSPGCGLAAGHAGGRWLVRRWRRDRGAQHQQHRPRRVGPGRVLPGDGRQQGSGVRPGVPGAGRTDRSARHRGRRDRLRRRRPDPGAEPGDHRCDQRPVAPRHCPGRTRPGLGPDCPATVQVSAPERVRQGRRRPRR